MKHPALIAVQSKNIAQIGHHAGHLFVRFKEGGLYRYDDVPEGIYHAGLGAESPGTWFLKEVKGRFRHHKLDG